MGFGLRSSSELSSDEVRGSSDDKDEHEDGAREVKDEHEDAVILLVDLLACRAIASAMDFPMSNSLST